MLQRTRAAESARKHTQLRACRRGRRTLPEVVRRENGLEEDRAHGGPARAGRNEHSPLRGAGQMAGGGGSAEHRLAGAGAAAGGRHRGTAVRSAVAGPATTPSAGAATGFAGKKGFEGLICREAGGKERNQGQAHCGYTTAEAKSTAVTQHPWGSSIARRSTGAGAGCERGARPVACAAGTASPRGTRERRARGRKVSTSSLEMAALDVPKSGTI